MDEEKINPQIEEKIEAKTEATGTEEDGDKEEQAIVRAAKDAATIAKEAEELKAKNLDKEEKLLERKEALNSLGGISPAGTAPIPNAPLTDTQYAEALERGEVNPLKEDGILN